MPISPSVPLYTQTFPLVYEIQPQNILDPQLLTSIPSISIAVDGVPISEDTISISMGSTHLWSANVTPIGYYSTVSYYWDFGDSQLLAAPPEIKEEQLFPETRGGADNCEDLLEAVPCFYEPHHGSGGTLTTIIPDGSGTNSNNIPYFSPAGYTTGTAATCTISGSVLTDALASFSGTNDMYVIVRHNWLVGTHGSNTLQILTPIYGPSTLFRGAPYRFYITDTSWNTLYTGYGTISPQTGLFTAPNAVWTANQYSGKWLVVLTAYKILNTLSPTTLSLYPTIPDSGTTPVWYNITSGINAITGTCTVSSGTVTITSQNPYYRNNVLSKNIITLTPSSGLGSPIKRVIASNTSNTITLGTTTNANVSVPDGNYTFSIATCDTSIVLASTETLYGGIMYFQSEVDIEEMINAGMTYFAFDSGEIIRLISSTPSPSVDNMYEVYVTRQALFKDIYYAKPHYAGEIATILSIRGTRDNTTASGILARTHMMYNRVLRNTDVFNATTYPSY